jgi:hypothetical protein
MPSIRPRILPVIDRVRAKIEDLGLRVYKVTIRQKDWPKQINAPNTVPVITDTVIVPWPRVRIDPPWIEQQTGTAGPVGSYTDRIFTIEKITPQHTRRDGTTGGHTPQEFDLTVPASNRQREKMLVITGDDGLDYECELISKEFDRAFNYKLKVRLKRRPNT